MKVEHEYFLRELLVGPAPTEMVWDQSLHGAREIGIEHDGSGAMQPASGPDSDGAMPGKFDLERRIVEMNLDAQATRHASQRLGHGRASAPRVPDAIFIFQEAQDAEEAGTTKGRHAQVFGLKAKRQPDALVTKESPQVPVKRLMRADHRQEPKEPRSHHIAPAQKRTLQARFHERQLGAILAQESAEARDVGRCQLADLPFHARHIRRAVEAPARAENKPILRVEPDELDLLGQRRASNPKDLIEHTRIQKEGRPQIELKSLRLDRRGPPADGAEPLDDRDA